LATKKTKSEIVASKGGVARSAALSAEKRAAIAKRAAIERWNRAEQLPKETHTGILKLGEGIPCSVLDNGMRVFSVNGLLRAFGSAAKGQRPIDEGGHSVPSFLSAANVRPYISADLMSLLASPISYQAMTGGRAAKGFEAEILHKICETLLDARAAGVLRQPQAGVAEAAELLMRGFARVGLVALIDEATGYQAERARDELQLILAAYISKELLPWTRKFPAEFFEQVYRLHGWEYKPGTAKRPQYVGKIINRYVYEALPDGVLDELRRKNPPINGHRRHKHFQFLSEDTGDPHLDKQIVAVTTIMKLSQGKTDFAANFKKLYPRLGDQLDLDLESEQPGLQLPAGGGVELTDLTGGASERALSVLRSGNAVSSRDLSQAVYGNTKEATRNKLRKLLTRMKSDGLVETPSPGIWRLRSPA
jgi:hypothetical protein